MKNLLPALTVICIILLVSCSKPSPVTDSPGTGSWTFGAVHDSCTTFQANTNNIRALALNGKDVLTIYSNSDSLPVISGTYAAGPFAGIGITLLSNDTEYEAISNSASQKINLSISGNQITMSGAGIALSNINRNDSATLNFTVTTTY